MPKRTDQYYEARGFSAYYIANCVFNIVSNPMLYIRGIEDILGDARTEFLMSPFKKYTNLHEFIRSISQELLVEDDGEDRLFLLGFLKIYDIPPPIFSLDDEDALSEFISESEAFDLAVDGLVEEVFHILFRDVAFLQKFNELCAGYISGSGFGQKFARRSGVLRREKIPIWVRRTVFHRDGGECRECKKSLTALTNRFETERYDHIVPLANYGANDVTNLQLLCEGCNVKKAARSMDVSKLYQRAIRP